MKRLQTRRALHFAALTGLLFGLLAAGCDGILGIDGFVAGCTQGEKRCSPTYGNWPQTCGANGRWQNEQPCGNGLTCENGACVAECTPKAFGCLDKGTPQRCTNAGVWETLPACEAGEECNAGECTCTVQDAKKCIGNAEATCESGKWQKKTVCSNQTCVNGTCQGKCVASTRYCLGDTPQECDPEGNWKALTPCNAGETCIGGSCGCKSGDRRCFKNQPQLCDASNQWENDGDPCTDKACDPIKVECVGSCEPGQTQCAGPNTAQQCNSKGEWENSACPLSCFGGVCAICTPGQLRCVGNTPQSCGIDGQWQEEPTCVKQTCIAGTCQGDCESGQKRCSADYPQTCTPSGTWENNGSACNACVECSPVTAACETDPVADADCTQPTAIEAGQLHTCALLPAGDLKCWGYNASGQLGLGDTNDRGSATGQMGTDLHRVVLGAGLLVQDIRAGASHTCVRFSDGSVKCWGENAFGQLGLGDTNDRGVDASSMVQDLTPLEFGGLGALLLATGANHTCASLSDGALRCWGSNLYGQLGLGDANARGDEPGEKAANLPIVDLGNGLGALALTAGEAHTCAVVSPIAVKCWGNNAFGQLGLGDTKTRGNHEGEMGANLPTIALDLPPGIIVKDLSAGAAHTCALLSNGTLLCWGNNDAGQLGLGNTEARGDNPDEMGAKLKTVDLGLNQGIAVIGVSAGGAHTCALLSNGKVKCWGKNDFGQLGLGDQNARGDGADEMGAHLPTVDLGPGVTATAIRTGHSHTCALLSSGRVKCWGRSVHGQLGLSDPLPRGDEPSDMGDHLPTVDL